MKPVLPLALLTLAASGHAVELIQNGSFESQPLGTGFTQTTSGSGTLIGDNSGITQGRVTTNSAYLGGFADALTSISQTITAPADTRGGTLSFDLTQYNADAAGFDFLSVFLDGATLATFDLGDDRPTDFYKTRPSLALPESFVAGTYTLSFSVGTNGNGADSSATLDNLSLDAWVQPVPEPATLAALGLGVAAVLRRRRR